ncbi:MAG TPA: hypothetical protein DEP84_31660 [Chloroflexi bacterium]|nr:hypothetical protein [Chloroflexota bacterium]
MSSTCPLCGDSGAQLWLTAPDFRCGGEQRYRLVRCNACGLIRQDPTASASILEAAYSQDYIPHAPPVPPQAPHLLRRLRLASHLGYSLSLPPASRNRMISSVMRWFARRVLPEGGRTPPWVSGGILLDVGCGSGNYLLAMRALGWQVLGVEPNEVAAVRARAAGLTVIATSLEKALIPPASIDVVTFWHVIEHLPDPLATLRHVRMLLRPTGRLLVEVPSLASVQARFFRGVWFHLDQPRHLTMYTPQTLRLLLEQAGFTIITLTTEADSKGWVASVADALASRRGRLASPATRNSRWLLRAATPLAWGEALVGRGALLRAAARRA